MDILVIYCWVKNYSKLSGVKQLLIMFLDSVEPEVQIAYSKGA